MERQLQHASRMDAIGQLTGGIAHDFNNLLVVITGNLDLLESELADKPKLLGYAQMATKAAWRGAELTRQLLAFSRKQALEPKVLDVNAVVRETASLLRRTIGEHVEVEMVLARDLPLAFVDKTQLESALTNLAINARDAMPEGGKLIFETADKQLDASFGMEGDEVAPGDYVMIAVSDAGVGIPPEILSRVFEPFFTTKSEGKGTGLGLAMIYGFAKQSRGHVRIYSEVGHGTTVRLYLPRGDGAPSQVAEAPTGSLMAPKGTKVLLVEDNPDVRRVAASQLAEYGYQVIEAENGYAAMNILRSDQPVDLLFSDAIMPGGMTGMQLAHEASIIRHGLKVLLTSGFAEASLNTARTAAGIPLITKPYRKQDLAKKIRDVLGGPTA
jgi:CheY-like chemotaxis protein